jgi:hypothetical protein
MFAGAADRVRFLGVNGGALRVNRFISSGMNSAWGSDAVTSCDRMRSTMEECPTAGATSKTRLKSGTA